MRNRGLLITAIALVVIGLVGLVSLASLITRRPATTSRRQPNTRATPLGEAIYVNGIGEDGLPIPRAGGMPMMGAIACVDCHGDDGQGGRIAMMMGSFEVPDIRYSTLTSPRREDDETEPAWTDDEIAQAIRDGTEPNG
ncbi:MAG: hypothetical protein HY876_10715 [Coriobacteriales bacterium]|nr:hypothetical protein [Coriobacteriales bacterium]